MASQSAAEARKRYATRENTPYELAQQRMERARRELPIIETLAARLVREANEEWNDADALLRTFEDSPGIPKQEFRAAS